MTLLQGLSARLRGVRGRARAALRSVTLGAAVLTAAACGGDAMAPAAGAIASIELSQRTLTLGVGSTAALEARMLDAAGKELPTGVVFWSSSAPEVARISANGVVTALTEGKATLAATAQGRSAIATLTVAPTAAAAVRLSATDVRLTVGQQSDLSATVVDAGGAALGRIVSWRSSNATVAAVDSTGHITAVAPGAASITASSEGRTATAAVTVSAIAVASVSLTPASASLVEGQSTQLAAEPRDASGRALAGRTVLWSSSAPGVATVSSTGQVVAIAAGTTTITATAEGRTAMASISVSKRPVSSLVVSPSQLSMTPGQATKLGVVLTDASGTVLSGRAVSFSSASTAIAQVAADGTVSAVSAGATVISVSSEGKTASVTVNVSPTPAATIRVVPADGALVVGESLSLSATVLDAAGNSLDRTVTWTSGAPTVASVSSGGRVTALAVGTAIILASVEGRVGSATITVRVVPVASVSITPATVTLAPNATASLSAVVRSAAGATLSDRPVFWTSSDANIATVSSVGVVTAIASGSAVISASVDGKSGTASVTVSRPAPAQVGRVTVSPTLATIKWSGPSNRSVQLTATAYTGATGGTLLPNAEFTWISSNPQVATVSPSGLVTGISDGIVTIAARSGISSGTAIVTSVRR